MKAIILAAGMGKRLGKYGKNLPKCLLSFNYKPLLEQQIGALRDGGVSEIVIIKGYLSEKINFPNVRYYLNEDFSNTNMVETLFKAEAEMDEDIIICYSDILYERRIIKKVLEAKVDIGVVVDNDYLDYWQARLANPKDDMESLVVDKEGKIVELGVTDCPAEKAKLRYVGILKFSKKGLTALKSVYHQNKGSFKKAFMTSLLQTLIDAGYRVEPIIVSRGWLEFDNVADIELAKQWLKDNTLNRFYDFNH
jgi:phosphoenolpyruvate phosphomutase